MTKPTTTSRLTCLATALATGLALMVTANVADAKGDGGNHFRNDSHFANRMDKSGPNTANVRSTGTNKRKRGGAPDFVISGQPTNVKRALPVKGSQFVISGQAVDVKKVLPAKSPHFVISGQPTDVKQVLPTTVAIPPTHPIPDGPPSILGDDLKSAGQAAGNATAVISAAPTIAGATGALLGVSAIVGTLEGHPIKATEDMAKQIVNDGVSAVEWIGSLF
jgi:hypothetical protein